MRVWDHLGNEPERPFSVKKGWSPRGGSPAPRAPGRVGGLQQVVGKKSPFAEPGMWTGYTEEDGRGKMTLPEYNHSKPPKAGNVPFWFFNLNLLTTKK